MPLPTIVAPVQQYKGLLLCERPSQISKAPAQASPFITGKSTNSVGLQPSREHTSALCEAKRNVMVAKDEGVLTLHRKWLKEQQKSRLTEKQLLEQENADKALKEQAFKDRMEKERLQALKDRPVGFPASSNGEQDESVHGLILATQTSTGFSFKNETTSKITSKPCAHKPMLQAKTKGKPKWAMTEEEAFDADLNEGSSLVQFSENLDLESFLNNIEVRAALLAIKEKVDNDVSDEDNASADEREKVIQETDDVISVCSSRPSQAGRPLRQRARVVSPTATASVCGSVTSSSVQHDHEWGVSKRRRDLIHQEAMDLAENILAKNAGLRAVHSRTSLARVLEELTRVGISQKEGKSDPKGDVPVEEKQTDRERKRSIL